MKNRTAHVTNTVLLRTVSLLVALTLVFYAAPVSAQDDAGGLSSAAQQILNDVNQARIDNGLPPLTLNPMLTAAAQNHVDDVIANGNWGHYGSDGSNVQMRVARAGYGSSSVSENWVAVSSPEQAIVWWMNDWIHRVNILGGHWDEIGVGAGVASNGYWIFVTDFGNPDGSPPVFVDAGRSSSETIEVLSIPAGGMDYTVEPGDTLLGIAIRYGLDWQDIAIANNLGEDDLLQIGQLLRLPSIGGTGGPVEEAVAATAVAGKQRYTVAAGDTLLTIGLRYGVTWQEIAAVNGLGEYDLLQIGQEIALPASLDEEIDEQPAADAASTVDEAETEGPAADASFKSASTVVSSGFQSDRLRSELPTAQSAEEWNGEQYTVRSGDTPLGIALSHGISLDELLAANDMREDDFLQIGQTLVIPGEAGEAAPPEVETSALQVEAAAEVESAAAETYVVRPGDTVFAIAMRLGVDWQEMLRANDLNEQSMLQPGQRLVVP